MPLSAIEIYGLKSGTDFIGVSDPSDSDARLIGETNSLEPSSLDIILAEIFKKAPSVGETTSGNATVSEVDKVRKVVGDPEL
jgi:hypothetical protein